MSVRAQISRHLDLEMCVFASHVSMQSFMVFPLAPKTGRPPLLAALPVRELSVERGSVEPLPVLFGASWLLLVAWPAGLPAFGSVVGI